MKRLTDDEIRRIGALFRQGDGAGKIAGKVGRSEYTVRDVLRGRCKRYRDILGGQLQNGRRKQTMPRRISDNEIRMIAELWESGVGFRRIADAMGAYRQTIREVVKMETLRSQSVLKRRPQRTGFSRDLSEWQTRKLQALAESYRDAKEHHDSCATRRQKPMPVDKPKYVPLPADIERECARIRATWTESEERKRRGVVDAPLEVDQFCLEGPEVWRALSVY